MAFLPEAVLRTGLGKLLAWKEAPQFWEENRAEDERKAWRDRFGPAVEGLREKCSLFPCVSLCGSFHQHDSQNSRPQSACKSWRRSQQGHLTCFQPSSPVEDKFSQMHRATTYVGHFVHSGHKGTGLREQKVGSGIQYTALGWLCLEERAHQHCEPGVICPEEPTFSNLHKGGTQTALQSSS